MSGVDGELSSVRVEVDGGAAASPDAPEVTAASSRGGRTGVLVLAVVALAAVAVAILALRPSEDTAADGTERAVPTSTIAPEEEETEDEIDDEEPEPDSIDIVPILVEGNSGIIQIVPEGVGFLGLAQSDASASPTILRSLDGQDWFNFEATVRTADGPNTTDVDWFNILNFEDGFMLTAIDFIDRAVPQSTIFVSSDGNEWVEFDVPTGTPPFFIPTNVSFNGLFGFAGGTDGTVEAFLTQYTSFDIGENGVCEVSQQVFGDSQPRSFDVFDCEGELLGRLDASSVVEPFVADDVLACAEIVRFVTGGGAFEFLRLDFDGNFTNLEAFAINELPSNITDGGIAGVDAPRTPDTGPCEEFVDVPPRAPAIFVIDGSFSEAQRFGFPSERFTFPGESLSAAFDSRVDVVGEVPVGEGRHLVVRFEDALWALDLDSGGWSDPLTSPDTPLPDRFDQGVILSDSGARAYTITDNLLITFDFVADDDGELVVHETIRPISLTDGLGQRVNFTDPLYADDELYFIASGVQTWAIETPPVPNE